MSGQFAVFGGADLIGDEEDEKVHRARLTGRTVLLPDGDVVEAVLGAWQGEHVAFICLLEGDTYAHATVDMGLVADCEHRALSLRSELSVYYKAMQQLLDTKNKTP